MSQPATGTFGAHDEYRYAVDVDALRNSDHGWLAELDDLAVHAGPPYQRMGIRAVSEGRWFTFDEHAATQQRLKARLLDERPEDVLVRPPGALEAARETHRLVTDWLARHHPDRPGTTGSEHSDPLAAAALAVQDDLCLMQRGDGDTDEGWRLTAGVLCFPTYWRLRDKVGRVQEDVHGPVPHYAADLAERVGRFFDRLAPDRIVVRRNWGFSPHPLLFVPDRSLPRPPGSDGPEGLWLRSERQTLRRLPRSSAILFGIRIQLAPMSALADHPDLCRRLAEAMGAWTPELVESRGGRHGRVAEVVTWLRDHQATHR